MAQIFHPSFNTLFRVGIFGALGMFVGTLWLLGLIARSDYVTRARVVRDQPVYFSHKHHVRNLGLDCRYCHWSVETSSFANIPATSLCMGCHAQIWSDSPMLEPVRASLRTGRPLRWTRVYDLPDFVYFDHSIHVAKGFGCVTCHGRVDEMPLTWREGTLHMEWCLECHRDPAAFIRPREAVLRMDWEPEGDQREIGRRLVTDHGIEVAQLTDCSVCHR